MDPGAIPDVDDLVKSAVKTILSASGQSQDTCRATNSILTTRAISAKCCRAFGAKLMSWSALPASILDQIESYMAR